MKDSTRFPILFAGLAVLIAAHAWSACPAGVDPKASKPLAQKSADTNCSPKSKNGFPLPDPKCTPGAANPTVTLAVLQSGKFKTSCERDIASSRSEKETTYDAYAIDHPTNNTGKTQTCELDHLVSLELGGADTVDNIWPQCGPPSVVLAKRFFKIKDRVENYLAAQVKAGNLTLAAAQHGIATDWTQYIDAATAHFKTHGSSGFGLDQ